MGAGIARQIAVQFPKTEASYSKFCKDSPIKANLLGNNHVTFESVPNKKGLIIANMFTQYNPGRDFNKAALEMSLFKLAHTLRPNEAIGFPWVGCGIGGGDQGEVMSIFSRAFNNRPNVFIVEYKP